MGVVGVVGVESLRTFLTLNRYLLSLLQQINDVLDHGVFRVSFLFYFHAANSYKGVQVLQMNSYLCFSSKKCVAWISFNLIFL